jgi:hypothetical protein
MAELLVQWGRVGTAVTIPPLTNTTCTNPTNYTINKSYSHKLIN